MNYGVDTLLKGIEVRQRRQLAARDTLLAKQEALLGDVINAGKRAQLQVEAVLEGELRRLREGYGSYGKYGVTKDYFTTLRDRNPPAVKDMAFSVRDVEKIEQDVKDLEQPLDPDKLVHEDLRVLLDYAQRHGQTEVTTSWLTRSGFKPAEVNRLLLAAEASKPVGRTTEEKAAFAREWDARVEQGRSNA